MTNEDFIKSVSLEGEEWRDVVGYEGFYMVSSLGRFISLPRKVRNRYGSFTTKISMKKASVFADTPTYSLYKIKLSKENVAKTYGLPRAPLPTISKSQFVFSNISAAL